MESEALIIGLPPAKPQPRIPALLISPHDDDFDSLHALFRRLQWRLEWAQTLRQARSVLTRCDLPVIVCAERLPDGTWRTVLDELAGAPAQLIVTSRLADERMWIDALDSGCYDVLPKPFGAAEAARAIAGAWLEWRIESAANLTRRRARA